LPVVPLLELWRLDLSTSLSYSGDGCSCTWSPRASSGTAACSGTRRTARRSARSCTTFRPQGGYGSTLALFIVLGTLVGDTAAALNLTYLLGFPLALLLDPPVEIVARDAMAHGPVVATRVARLADDVRDGGPARSCRRTTPAALRGAVAFLLASPARRETLGLAARGRRRALSPRTAATALEKALRSASSGAAAVDSNTLQTVRASTTGSA